MLWSLRLTVVEFTVVVVPETCKLPVITIVSPLSAPIVMFSFDAPPDDSKLASLVNKFALLTSTSVFDVNVRFDCKYDCSTLTSILLTVPASLIISSSVLAKPDVKAVLPDIILLLSIEASTAAD